MSSAFLAGRQATKPIRVSGGSVKRWGSSPTPHWSGWSAHTGKRLIFLATAQFETVTR
jgi:hypothetical protein